MNKKNFVLDTGILLASPYSIYAFDEHNVIVPAIVISEISSMVEKGVHERTGLEAIRIIEEMRGKGDITKGVDLPGGGIFSVYAVRGRMPLPHHEEMLRVCSSIKEETGNAILVTNNLPLQIKADMNGICAEPYKTEQMVDPDKQYQGRGEIVVTPETIDRLYKEGTVDALDSVMCDYEPSNESVLIENQYFILRDVSDPKHTGLARYREGKLLRLRSAEAWGTKPRNVGQRFAMDALLAPPEEIPLVILKGSAGTGKTFLTCAAALQGVVEERLYDRCITTRSNFELDRSIGYLKGSETQKVMPLLAGISDSLGLLTKNFGQKTKDGLQLPSSYATKLYEDKIFVATALGFLRGRSLTRSFVIVDEAQNMTPHQMFSTVSRAAEGSKLVLCGDIDQIDVPTLDSRTNGLSFASEKMKGSVHVAQVGFKQEECVRSPLASEALSRMSPKGTGIIWR